MAKVQVVGHHFALDTTLEVLQRLRLVHLVDVHAAGFDLDPLPVEDSRPFELDRLRGLRARLEALARLRLDPAEEEEPSRGVDAHDYATVDLDALAAELDELTPRVELLVGRLDDLDAEADALPRHVASLRRLLPLMPELGPLERYETVALLVDRRYEGVLDALSEELASLTGDRFEVISDRLDARTVGAALVFPPEASGAVHALLGREQVSQVRLPTPFERLTFSDALVAMERRLAELPGDVEATRRALDELLIPGPDWQAARCLEARVAQLEARRALGATRRTFVATGWVPRARLPRLTETLAAEAGDAVAVEVLEPGPGEEPPALLANPAPARPFEFLVRLLALPRYGTIDPTLLMSVFMPLFFGMMLGDIVYGAVLLAGSVWLGRRHGGRSPALRAVGRVLMLGAAWAVVWGVVYGEALGDLGRRAFGLQPIWISREEGLEPLLVFSVAVGAAHVTLGLALGIWAAWHARRPHDLAQRAATLLALGGLFLLAGVAAGRLPGGFLTPAVAALVAGLAVLVGVDGVLGIVLGPLELLGVLGNVLSYLRIAAIGLASVELARVANELGAAGPLWLGVVVATFFHALNLALGAFSPTIQALRLHYVEFFGRFYEEGGQPYVPFGASLTGSGR
jgi:V/A-type H+-transporting ATPase subunit I